MGVIPAIATIVAAFIDDPVERWLYPEEAAYLEHFPRFVVAFAGAGIVSAVQDFAAVAIWLPPDAEPDGDAIAAVLADTVDPAKHEDTFAVAEQMDAAPRPAACRSGRTASHGRYQCGKRGCAASICSATANVSSCLAGSTVSASTAAIASPSGSAPGGSHMETAAKSSTEDTIPAPANATTKRGKDWR